MERDRDCSASARVGLHVCCAPCLGRTRAALRAGAAGAFPEIAGIFFFNPNIHPLLEFRRRVKALRIYLERDSLSAEIEESYGLEEYLRLMYADGGLPARRRDRCYRCYLYRLGKAAAWAKAAGLTGFSTTLLASREQDRDAIAAAGREAGALADIDFVAGDFAACEADARLMRGVYKQQYCGCLFSEAERYRGTAKHLYRGGGTGGDNGEDD